MAVYNEESWKMIDYKKLINHPNKETQEWWQRLSANEVGKLWKGVRRNDDRTQQVKGLDKVNFIRRLHVPDGKKITYARFCCDIQLQKEDINQTRLTVDRAD